MLLSLEHLLGADDYLQLRGLGVRLDTSMRTAVAERVSAALAFLHRHGIVASDIAPNNLLVGFATGRPEVCFVDLAVGAQPTIPMIGCGWGGSGNFAASPYAKTAPPAVANQ